MRITSQKELHKRAIAILELIELAERRIFEQERYIKQYHTMFSTHKNEERIQSHIAAIERLTKSYYNTLERINNLNK